ncbi:site-specific integrase [Pseudoxanthomonas suwonensis]|jgi:Site-specific recombinase XerD|uniref:site-specific integrase n=1 Tax=Pseudoxanthomonas suwonensis TaxID=314722 RepID=UPI00138EF724|nr:site-specific integrase [Pseudoxanthomonas suwonensis]KAF1703693.1 integrase [Pseudoxanthomonas suwonensis]
MLSVHVLAGGERVPMLHDEQGVPLFYPTLFATSQLRNAGAAVNTIRNKLADLVVLHRWEQANSRDLIAEFRTGRFLTLADVVSLRDFAKLDMRKLKPIGPGSKKRGGAVVDFLEARVASIPAQTTIVGQQHFNRISTFADYLEFTASVLTQHQNSTRIAQDIARMAKAIRKHRPRGLAKQKDEDPDLRSPPSDLVERFMEVGAEGDPRNPFLNPEVQLRNSIIFGLLRHTGMRRGELLSLRLEQIDLGHEPYVWVRRNQDDKHDPRPYQPVTKTRERPLPIPEALANQIDRYMLKVRPTIAPARKHPYLLVSHRKGSTWGKPLSASALSSQIFPRMREVDSAFKAIHPHALRHHFNYELSVSIDKHNARVRSENGSGVAPISEGREQDVRAFLNGHRNKASGAVYNKRHVREASDRAARQIQEGSKRIETFKDDHD